MTQTPFPEMKFLPKPKLKIIRTDSPIEYVRLPVIPIKRGAVRSS